MALFDSRLLNRLRHVYLASRQAGGGLLAGPRAKLPAGGTELTGHRDYAPGDDYRYLDWNLCARHDELLVKQFQGEAERPVYILLDCSRSMSVGRPAKFDVARQAVAALAYVALADLEQVAVLAFSDRIAAGLSPIRHKAMILKLVSFLEGLTPRPEPTDLAAVAKGFVRRRQRQGLAVVVSDLYDRDPAGFRLGLDVLRSRGYQPRVVQIYDPAEAEPGLPSVGHRRCSTEWTGDSELLDVETGALWQVTVTEKHLERYRRIYAEFHRSVRSYCDGHGIRHAQVRTDLPQDRLLLTAVGATS